MIQEQPSKTWIPITVAIIGGCFAIIAALVSGFADRIADRVLPPSTPIASVQTPVQAPTSEPLRLPDTLVINNANYPYPDPGSSPYCIAKEVNTNGRNRISYEIEVPEGWVMAWNSYKAYWPGGQYETDGLLVITGPWQGTIDIDTGGSCSGPVEWTTFVVDDRMKDYPVASRPIYYLGQKP